MSYNPLVSVIIPVRTIGYHIIFENLPAFEVQTYRTFEVILLPNEHTPYDMELLKKYVWLRIVPTGKITRPAQKRDVGAKEAKGEIIAFIDDDAYPSPDWLEKAIPLFQTKDVAAVCGPGVLPPNTNLWEQVFDSVLTAFIGSGGYAYRFTKGNRQYVDDYPSMNFLTCKALFLKLDGFNSDYWPGEDSKLCNDIVYVAKKKILYDPEVLIYHHRRQEFQSYIKQHGNYGFHRGAFFAHGDKNSRRFLYIIPAAFTIYLSSLSLLWILAFVLKISIPYLKTYTIPTLLYGIGMLYIFITSLFRHRNLKVAILSPIVLFCTHIFYGIMFMKGFGKGLNSKKNIYE